MAGLLKRFPPGFDLTDLPELKEPLYQNCFIFTYAFLNCLRRYTSERRFNENLSTAVHKDLDSVKTNIFSTRCLLKAVTMQGAFEPTSLQQIALFLEKFQIFVDGELGTRKSFHWRDFHEHVKGLSRRIDRFVELKDSLVQPLEHLTQWPFPALSHPNLIIDTEQSIPTAARHTHFNTQAGPSPAMAQKIAENTKQAMDMYNLMIRYPVRQFREIDRWLSSSPCLNALRNEYAIKQATFNKAASLISTIYRYKLIGVLRDALAIVMDSFKRERSLSNDLEDTDDLCEPLNEAEYDENLIEINPAVFETELLPSNLLNSAFDEEVSLYAQSNLPGPNQLCDKAVANAVEKIAGWSHRGLRERITDAKLFAQFDLHRHKEYQHKGSRLHHLPEGAERSIKAVSEALKLYHRTVNEQHRLMIEVVIRVYLETLSVLESFHLWAEDVEKERLRGNQDMGEALEFVRTWIKFLTQEIEELRNAKRLHNVIFNVPKNYGIIEHYVIKYLIHF